MFNLLRTKSNQLNTAYQKLNKHMMHIDQIKTYYAYIISEISLLNIFYEIFNSDIIFRYDVIVIVVLVETKYFFFWDV